MTGPAGTRRPAGWRVGSLAGVPVYLGRSWILILVVIAMVFGPVVRTVVPSLGSAAYLVAGGFAVLLLLSVLVHEGAHALVGRACGYRVNRIVADFWGGHTAYDSTDSTPGRSALVAIAGPLANGVLAGLGWLLLQVLPEGVPWLVAVAFTYANGFVALFNLLPGLPLDGGFLVDSLVWRLTGSRGAGMVVAGWCGRVVTGGLLLWALGPTLVSGQPITLTRVLWVVLIGSFLWIGAGDAIRVGRARQVFERTTVGSVCRPVARVPVGATVGELPPVPPGVEVVAVDPTGHPVGILDREALARVPGVLHATTPVTTVLRRQPDGWVVTARPDDPVTDVVVTMQRLRTPVVAVRAPDGPLLGLVHARDV
jgi:Zn-dependent protease